MQNQQTSQAKGFTLTLLDSNTLSVNLNFTEAHYAEQVLRGLVHSGFRVTIEETIIEVPAHVQALKNFDHKYQQSTMNCAAPTGYVGERTSVEHEPMTYRHDPGRIIFGDERE